MNGLRTVILPRGTLLVTSTRSESFAFTTITSILFYDYPLSYHIKKDSIHVASSRWTSCAVNCFSSCLCSLSKVTIYCRPYLHIRLVESVVVVHATTRRCRIDQNTTEVASGPKGIPGTSGIYPAGGHYLITTQL